MTYDNSEYYSILSVSSKQLNSTVKVANDNYLMYLSIYSSDNVSNAYSNRQVHSELSGTYLICLIY